MSSSTWFPNYAPIEYSVDNQHLKVIVMDAPATGYEINWVKPLLDYGVKYVVCTADSISGGGDYSRDPFLKAGIDVIDLVFADGTEPPNSVVTAWLDLTKKAMDEKVCLAVHCLAGLGRAPALVAISLIELGLDATDAILHVRESRRGAISARQVKFLQDYKMRGVLKQKKQLCLCFGRGKGNHTILLLMFMVLLSIGIILMSLPRAVSRGTQTIKYKGEKPI